MTALEELRERRRLLDEAIEALEALERRFGPGAVPAGGPVELAPARAPEDPKRPTAARAESAVRRALLAGHNRPKAIREATGLPKWKVDEALQTLEDRAVIRGEGVTRARVYRVL